MFILERPLGRADLESRARILVQQLGGRWGGASGLCHCPVHDDRSPSLSIRPGHSDLLFKCFAGCDTIDVLRAIGRLNTSAALPNLGRATAASQVDDDWLLCRATELWADTRSMIGTPVERYLQNRAIDRAAHSLRFHPRTPLGPSGHTVFRPAMIAAVQQGSQVIAVQRTFLDAGSARRARDLGNPRRMLGRPVRGAVMLGDAADELGLAEGVETAFSAMILLGIPVWAVLGTERLPHIAVPSRIARLVLLPDNDRPGRRAEVIAREAHARPGRIIETLWPWHGLNDWNDVLRKEGERVGGRVRQAA